MRFLFLCCLCALVSSSSITTRLQKRITELEESSAKEQNVGRPLIVPYFGPDDVSFDGTMEGHEISWIDRTIESHKRNGNGMIRYFVYNLKHPRIVDKLIEAYLAGVRVQIMIEASTFAGARYKIHSQFAEKGVAVFKDRKLMTPEDRMRSFFCGAKVGSLFHVKMRVFSLNGETVLLTGSLNPGTESMLNDESLYVIRDAPTISKYVAFSEALIASTEKLYVNSWDDNALMNVVFSPSKEGYDVGRRILNWIDAENEFIFITVFSLRIFGNKNHDLLTALRNAVNRGVEIWVVTDRKQSDGPSGFGDVFEQMIRDLSPRIIMYEVINDAGMFNAMHLKDAIFGLTNPKVVTDTSNWSAAAMGSCASLVKSQVVAKACSAAQSAESALFVSKSAFGNRVFRHHITLLDRYWRQIPIQKTGDPSPQEAWSRLISRFGSSNLPFQRTSIFVQATTKPGEYIELRGELKSGRGGEFSYCNSLNSDTRAFKQSYRRLSWQEGTAMDWTCDRSANSQSSYVNNGFGYDPENDQVGGSNWWKALMYVDGKEGLDIEFKLVKTRGLGGEVIQWESGANHIAKTGQTTRTTFR